MSERDELERLIRELHGARIRGDLPRLCELFTTDAYLRITGASDGKPLVIAARGAAEIRTWLAMLIKNFQLSDYELLSTIVDGARASAHWRVHIRSKVTGRVVPTELIDVIDTREALISAHTELFVPVPAM